MRFIYKNIRNLYKRFVIYKIKKDLIETYTKYQCKEFFDYHIKKRYLETLNSKTKTNRIYAMTDIIEFIILLILIISLIMGVYVIWWHAFHCVFT